ncbi:hypothetical protein [Humibacter sp.]|uniref:hypothetical protein n=1 Tax=Humibacter sp. TaxID=1940291 RepID=UPI003F7E3932
MMGWAGFPNLFNDSAYYQGDYWSPAESSGVIVNTARCNQGSYSETTWGAKQLANVRAQGKNTGHYLFNGNLDRYTVGRLWAQTCRRNGFDPVTEVLGYDCEDEGGTNTHAWGPADVITCQQGFNDEWGSPIPWSAIRAYMNKDVNGRFDWSQLVALGAQLWYARPDGPLDQAYWPTVWAKQDGTFQGVDANGYTTFVTGSVAPLEKGSPMSTLYFTDLPSDATQIPAELKAIGAVPGRIWALAGDGQGKAAWIESQDGPGWVNSVAKFHAGATTSVPMSFDGYMNLRKLYLDGATQEAATITIDPTALNTALQTAVQGLQFQLTGQIKEG